MGCVEKLKKSPTWVKILLGFIVLAVVVTAITVPIVLTSENTTIAPSSSTSVPTIPTTTAAPLTNQHIRIECFPFKTMVEENCTAAGCMWEPHNSGYPSCFLPNSSVYGYEINGPKTNLPDGNGFTVDLRRRSPFTLYGGDYDEVTFEVKYYSDSTLGFAFYPKGVGQTDLRPPVVVTPPSTGATNNVMYEVQVADETTGQPFNIQIIRKSSKAVIFDTSLGGLTIAEQFLMISTKLNSRYVYGFGENTHDTLLHDMIYRMWPIFSRGASPGRKDLNVYGAQPFYMSSEEDGSSHGVFLLNSHAMDVTTMPHPGLTFRTIGGMLEFFVFLGPEPESVVKQYSEVIGRTFMPPYFSLGFHLSRWGYQNTSNIEDVINRTRSLQIPQDVQYADIDYMDLRKVFTIDSANFGDLPALVEEVKSEGLRFVVILDPAIPNQPGYLPFTRGDRGKVFIQWANSTLKPENQATNDNNLYGRVWPRFKTAFPDFLKPATGTWWTDEIRRFYTQLKFDALWIDMNEPSNFLTDACGPLCGQLNITLPPLPPPLPPQLPSPLPSLLVCPENQWDDPPYETMAAHVGRTKRLSERTICMASLAGPNDEYLHYEVHNLYGYSHAIVTQNAVRTVLAGKRSMVLSRSTFAGSGKHAGHWLGDNYSTWKQMANSIIGMLEFNMFNIPYVGADICGFALNAEEELCERWMELGAFYTFSRNHNDIGFRPQDPGQWPDTVAVSSRKALNIRYRLLPYLYTLFYDSHTQGGTVIRPLYHEYPKDLKARSIDKQFMWGPSMLISPVLEKGKTKVDVYIPDDVWYDYYTGQRVTAVGNTVLSAPRDHINLHLRGGYILPAQKPDLNTMRSRQNSFELLVPLNAEKEARGKLFWDDGESLDTVENGLYQISTFEFQTNTLRISVQKGSDSWSPIEQMLEMVQIMGWPSKPASIAVNGENLQPDDYSYDQTTQNLFLTYKFNMNNNYNITFS